MSARYRVEVLAVEGAALLGNRLGDPVRRELPVVVPADVDPAEPLPLLFVLAGYSGVGRLALSDDPWSEGLQQRIERLCAEGRLGPMRYALPDCFTRYGGSQYLDSDATGRYESHLWQDLLPAVRARYAVARIGLVGKSSGGYGALVQAMRHPQHVAAIACHAPDSAFEYSYLPDFPKAARALRRHGGLDGFLAHFDASQKKRSLLDAMGPLAMASCYSPDPSEPRGFALPFDVETGALREAVWRRWLAWDPVRMVDPAQHPDAAEHLAALSGLRLLHLDAGTRDEYALDAGARMLSARLRQAGVPHVHEEFDDGHMNLTWRYDVSFPRLYDALK